MWPTQFMSNALRRISRLMSREQPARGLRVAHLLDAYRHRRCAVRHTVTLDAAHHLGERAIQHMVELAHNFAFVPEELLEILHPFEVADHHAAGVAQYVRHDEN